MPILSESDAPTATLALLLAMLAFLVLVITYQLGRNAATPDATEEREAAEAAEYFHSLRGLFGTDSASIVTIDIQTRPATPLLELAAQRSLGSPSEYQGTGWLDA